MSETALKRAIVGAWNVLESRLWGAICGLNIMGLRLESVSNLREHWSKRAKRTRAHREIAEGETRAAIAVSPELLTLDGLVVEIVRVAPRQLDDDNLRGAAKAIRDGIADALGIDDRDPRVTWKYDQAKGKPREYACVIAFRRVA